MEVTIDELVDNLEEEKNLSEKEVNELKMVLQISSKNIERGGIAEFIKSIRERIDAPTSTVFTQTGLNVAEFKVISESVAKVVIKEQIEAKERLKKEQLPEEEIKVSNEENDAEHKNDKEVKVKEILESFDDMARDVYGIDTTNISAETKRDMAEGILRGQKYIAILDKLEGLGYEGDVLFEEADKLAGYKGASGKAQRKLDVYDATMHNAHKRSEETGKPVEECLKAESKENKHFLKAMGETMDSFKKCIFNKEKRKETRAIKTQAAIRELQNEQDDLRRDIKKFKKTGYNHEGLTVKMLERDKKDEEISRLTRELEVYEELTPEKQAKREEKKRILEEAKAIYFTSNKTAFEVFKELRDKGKTEDINLYDMIYAFSQEALNVSDADRNNIVKNERDMRRLSLQMESWEILKNNAMTMASGDERKRLIQDYEEKIRKARDEITKKRGIVMKVKNTVVNFKGGEKSYINRLAKGNDDSTGIISTSPKINEEDKKIAEAQMVSTERIVEKYKITPNNFNEGIEELADLQKIEEPTVNAQKESSENEVDNPLIVSTMNVNGDEITVSEQTTEKDEKEER